MNLDLTLHSARLQIPLPALLRHAADVLAKAGDVAPATATTVAQARALAPKIGEPWQGGIYAGICRGVDGADDHHLILCEDKPDDDYLEWQPALDWAAELRTAGQADWSLPTRAESAVLFGNLRDRFVAEWHWTSEQYSAGNAWNQGFSNGGQGHAGKGYEGRARAVRRFKLNP